MNIKTYEFNYEETVTSAGTVAGRVVSFNTTEQGLIKQSLPATTPYVFKEVTSE